MKQITNSESYNVFLETLSMGQRDESKMYRFWSRLESASNPEDMHKQFELVLTRQERDELISLLQAA